MESIACHLVVQEDSNALLKASSSARGALTPVFAASFLFFRIPRHFLGVEKGV